MGGGEKEALAKERRAGGQSGKEPRARRAHTRGCDVAVEREIICLKFNYDL